MTKSWFGEAESELAALLETVRNAGREAGWSGVEARDHVVALVQARLGIVETRLHGAIKEDPAQVAERLRGLGPAGRLGLGSLTRIGRRAVMTYRYNQAVKRATQAQAWMIGRRELALAAFDFERARAATARAMDSHHMKPAIREGEQS